MELQQRKFNPNKNKLIFDDPINHRIYRIPYNKAMKKLQPILNQNLIHKNATTE